MSNSFFCVPSVRRGQISSSPTWPNKILLFWSLFLKSVSHRRQSHVSLTGKLNHINTPAQSILVLPTSEQPGCPLLTFPATAPGAGPSPAPLSPAPSLPRLFELKYIQLEKYETPKWDWHIYAIDTMYEIDNWLEPTVEHKGLYSLLSGDLKGKEIQKRGNICIRIDNLMASPTQ